jgi:hypothetical protein
MSTKICPDCGSSSVVISYPIPIQIDIPGYSGSVDSEAYECLKCDAIWCTDRQKKELLKLLKDRILKKKSEQEKMS